MKYLALFVFMLFALSCGPTARLERQVSVYFSDYRPYAEIGFFVSPNPYNAGPYESLGELLIEVEPAKTVRASNDGIYIARYFNIEKISSEELLDMAVAEALKRDANGIVNYKVTFPSENVGNTYIVSGLCIRRL